MGQRPIYPRGSVQSPVYIPRIARRSLAYTHPGMGKTPSLLVSLRILLVPAVNTCALNCAHDTAVQTAVTAVKLEK